MTDSDKSYLAYMAIRLLEVKRLLKPTGSIYLHCDPTMSHWLKLLLDAILGRGGFRNEIVWSYQRWTGATRHFQRMHDSLFFYAMSRDAIFNKLMESYSRKSKHTHARRSAIGASGRLEQSYTPDGSRKKAMRDVWEISYLNSQAKLSHYRGHLPKDAKKDTIKPLTRRKPAQRDSVSERAQRTEGSRPRLGNGGWT